MVGDTGEQRFYIINLFYQFDVKEQVYDPGYLATIAHRYGYQAGVVALEELPACNSFTFIQVVFNPYFPFSGSTFIQAAAYIQPLWQDQ